MLPKTGYLTIYHDEYPTKLNTEIDIRPVIKKKTGYPKSKGIFCGSGRLDFRECDLTK